MNLFVHGKDFVNNVPSNENAKNICQSCFFDEKVLEGRSLPTDVTTCSSGNNGYLAKF